MAFLARKSAKRIVESCRPCLGKLWHRERPKPAAKIVRPGFVVLWTRGISTDAPWKITLVRGATWRPMESSLKTAALLGMITSTSQCQAWDLGTPRKMPPDNYQFFAPGFVLSTLAIIIWASWMNLVPSRLPHFASLSNSPHTQPIQLGPLPFSSQFSETVVRQSTCQSRLIPGTKTAGFDHHARVPALYRASHGGDPSSNGEEWTGNWGGWGRVHGHCGDPPSQEGHDAESRQKIGSAMLWSHLSS